MCINFYNNDPILLNLKLKLLVTFSQETFIVWENTMMFGTIVVMTDFVKNNK